MILEKSPIPLYFQLKEIIKEKIVSNELEGQERLPSESELCAEYNVSRVTVRQALSELMNEGLIYRVRGKGTFVTDNQGVKQLSLKGTIENLIALGHDVKVKLIRFSEEKPPSQIAKYLQLTQNQTVFLSEFVRTGPKGPFCHLFSYLPYELGKKITRDELEDSSIEMITFVENKSKSLAFRASQIIDVALATKATAKNLKIKPNSPVLFIERIYYSREGEILFITHNYFRSDLYKHRAELTRT